MTGASLLAQQVLISIPGEDDATCFTVPFLSRNNRPIVWRLLLGLPPLTGKDSINGYLSLIRRCPSPDFERILDDSFRTCRGGVDELELDERKIIRILNALVCSPDADIRYIQGMNVVLAPLLVTMPSEVDVFESFSVIINKRIPSYLATKNLDGAHRACSLIDSCLAIMDPPLYKHLRARLGSTELLTFSTVLSLFANLKPIEEVVRVWDVLMSMGFHFIILLVCSQHILARDVILREPSGSK
jgi:cell cycle arrest protein BUB2